MELTANNNKLLSVTGTILEASDMFGGIPFEWNKKQKCIRIKSPGYIKYTKIRLAYTLVYYVLSTIQIWRSWDEGSYVVNSFSAASTGAIITCAPSAWVCMTQYEEIANLLAAFARFEQRRIHALTLDPVSSSYFFRTIVKLSGFLAYCGVLVLPLEALNAFMNPCLPVFVGYGLIPQCKGVVGLLRRDLWTPWDLILRLVTSGFYFMALTTIGQSLLIVTCQGVLQGFCVPSYVEACTNCLKRGRYTSACYMYREVQILLVIFRDVYFKRAMVGFFVGVLVVQITLAFGAFEMYRNGQVGEAIAFFLPMIVIIAWIHVLIFGIVGILGSVYSSGTHFEQVARRQRKASSRLWLKKFLVSCPTMKIQLMGKYHIDNITAVNLEDFAWQSTINLMLM